MNSVTKLQLLKQVGRKRKGKARPYSLTRKYEVAYARELLAISRQCKSEGREILALIKSDGIYVGDAVFGGAPSFLGKIKNKVALGISNKVKSISQAIASKIVFGQADATDLMLAKQIKDMTGLNAQALIKASNLQPVLDASISANIALIESIPTQYHARLETLLMTAIQNGKGTKWLEDEIKKLGQVTDARAKLIARDQIGKINTAVNKARQGELGIEEYRWRTCRDEKVRHKHRRREGQVFRWDTPPDDGEGHAGEPVNCRCGAEPVLDDD